MHVGGVGNVEVCVCGGGALGMERYNAPITNDAKRGEKEDNVEVG